MVASSSGRNSAMHLLILWFSCLLARKAYELVPETYRQKFRNYLKYDSKTHVEFAREKENLFN